MMPVGRQAENGEGEVRRERVPEVSLANVRTSGPSGPTNPRGERRAAKEGSEVEKLTA